ncbi:MAG TPA: hypothetical protein PK413_10175 [Thermoanaerobaculia bacterium]|nr:hypothetical protein [Thermoanaerobaculia bacterium]
MPQLARKAQVLFSEEQYRQLAEIADRAKQPLSKLLRRAAEVVYLEPARRQAKRDALERLFSLPPAEAPEDYSEWEGQYLEDRFGHRG